MLVLTGYTGNTVRKVTERGSEVEGGMKMMYKEER